jgi:Holliday junction resolvase
MVKRVDHNQAEIIRALRAIGCSVLDLSQVGMGCPDLMIGHHNQNYLVEVKNAADRAPRLTVAEETFIRGWTGQVAVVTTLQDAIAVIQNGE